MVVKMATSQNGGHGTEATAGVAETQQESAETNEGEMLVSGDQHSSDLEDGGMDGQPNCGDGGGDSDDSMDFDDDDDDDDDGSDLMSNTTLGDDITAQLAAAGPVGMAAAAAINSSKKRKRPHSFETNPSIRRRQQTRLLRKLRQTIDEYATRVGQQAIVLIATPGKPQNNFRVFGAKPLEDVVKNVKSTVLQDLETALAHHAPPPAQDDPSLYELPPLVIDGIPTPVEKMTQAQLRAFIPLMLKFSTGRGKPGWGKESTRPPWWPGEVPWANVRMDARPEDDKQRVSWTHALRQIVINCYKYHGREDLLPAFSEDAVQEDANTPTTATTTTTTTATTQATASTRPPKLVKVETEVEQQQQQQQQIEQQNVLVVEQSQQQLVQQQQQQPQQQSANQQQQQQQQQQYAPTVVQTISNPDGTVSIIQVDPHSFTNSFFQVDPNNPIITLPDGTTAQVVAAQGVTAVNNPSDDDSDQQQQQQSNDHRNHLLNGGNGNGGNGGQNKPMIWQFVPSGQLTGVTSSDGVTTLTNAADGTTVTTVDLTAVTESALGGQEGQHHILLTGEDGQTYPVSVSGMITVPAMYQAMVANISQIQTTTNGNGGNQSDASVQVLGPLISSLPKSDSNGGDDGGVAMVTATNGNGAAASVAGGLAPMSISINNIGHHHHQHQQQQQQQQHILQVIDLNQYPTARWLTADSSTGGRKMATAATSQQQQILNGEVVTVDSASILASAMQQVTSADVVVDHIMVETSNPPSSNSN